MNLHLGTYGWYAIGRYGTLAVIAAAAWLSRQRWFPHRHTGYVSASGRAWECRQCGKLPAGAYQTGRNALAGMRDYREPDEGGDAEECGPEPPHLWKLTAYGRGHGFHYARVRSTDAVERHYDVDGPCECPNAAGYLADRQIPGLVSQDAADRYLAGFSGQ